jgi:hypothetical protein
MALAISRGRETATSVRSLVTVLNSTFPVSSTFCMRLRCSTCMRTTDLSSTSSRLLLTIPDDRKALASVTV